MSNNYTKTILNFIKQKFDKFDRWAVQPDWSQNDTSSPDFIKNRVGGYEQMFSEVKTISPQTVSITDGRAHFFGTPGGASLYFCDTDYTGNMPSISDLERYTNLMFATGKTALDFGEPKKMDTSTLVVVDLGDGNYSIGSKIAASDITSKLNNTYVLVVTDSLTADYTDGTMTVPKGIYTSARYVSSYYSNRITSVDIPISKTEIIKISEKYLELPEQAKSDWDVNDPDSLGYIKNRPFYKYTESDVVARTITIAQHASSPVSYESLGLIEGEIVSIVLRTESKPRGEIMTETVLSDAGTLYFSISAGGVEVLRFKDTSVDIVMAQWLSAVGGAEVDLTFTRSSTAFKKIDPEYLPICESIKIHSQEDAKDYLLTVKNGALTITEVTL